MPQFGHYPAVIRAVVLDHIRAHGDDGSLTARVVREETERRAGLAAGSLKEHKEELMKVIEEVLGEQPKVPASAAAEAASEASAASAAECVATRAVVEMDPAAAARLLDSAEAAAEPASLLEQLEASCASRPAAEHLVAAGLVARLSRRLAPGSDRALAALSVRILTATSLHDGLTAEMLKSVELVPAVLAALTTATDTLAIPLVDLVHNLADSDANRMRLTAGGCLPALTRQLLEPTGSATLKEHSHNAAASLAGVPDTELSFPEIIARCCASRIPGIQREGVRAMTLVAQKPELRGRLAVVSGLPEGLRAAAASRDAASAEAAAELLATLKL